MFSFSTMDVLQFLDALDGLDGGDMKVLNFLDALDAVDVEIGGDDEEIDRGLPDLDNPLEALSQSEFR